MTAPPLEHPEKQRLIAFGMGKLAPDEATQIEEHLERCPDCCETILDLQDDTFVGLLRQCELPAIDPDQTNVTLDFASGATAGSLPAVELPRELREHGRYEIQELIGRGGMGDVYRAQHRVMNRPVALKVIRPELVKNSGAVLRFHREVQAAARLHHGNIVAAYDAEQAGDAHYLVMEFVDGVNLDEVIRKNGPLPVERACDYIRQAAAGLQHAHELGMVHRDIKPHNLMLQAGPDASAAGVIKILDFGLAGFATELALEEKNEAAEGQATLPESATLQLTQIGAMMGTPDYMAPEQAANAHTADIRADIYSLGCTFYTLLAGRPPFAQRALMEKLKAHAELELPPLAEVRSDVHAEVEAVLRKMLAKDPAARFQTPQEVANALAQALRGISQPMLSSRGPRNRRKLLALALGGLAVALAGVILLVTSQGTLEIRSEVADLDVVVSQGGNEVLLKDLATGSTVKRLGSGQWDINLAGDRNDVKLDKRGFTLSRFGKVIVTAQLVKDVGGGNSVSTKPDAIELLAELAGHTNVVRAVRFLPGNERLVSVDGNGNVIVWDAKTRRIARRFKIPGETYSDADISADGRLLAVGSDWGTTKGRLEIWDIAKGAALHRITHKLDYLEQMRFSPDGSKLMAVGSPPVAVLWDVASGTETRTIESGFPSREVKASAFTPDGTAVVLACTGRVKVFDLASGAAKDEIILPHDRVVNELVFLPGQSRLVALQGGGWVSLVDTKSWTADKTLPSATGELLRSGAIINDELLITGSDQGALQLRKLDGTTRATAQCGAGCCLNVSVSSDARHAVTAGGWLFDSETRKWTVTSDFKLRLWELPENVGLQPTPHFNGRDLTGWKMQPDKPGNWRVENGVLIGGKLDGGSEEENSFLVTEKSDFTNFHLKLEAKLNPGAADSGVLFDFADGSWAEANIAFNPTKRDQYVGSLMVAGTKPNNVTWQAAPRDLASPGQWFTFEVTALGRQITTKVNGKIAVVHTQRKKATGPIRLQDHGPFTVAEFRKIEIIELDEQGKPLHQPTSPEACAPPLTIGMNDEFGMLFAGRLVAPAELSRVLQAALKENPERVVAIDLPKKKWTVAAHVDQLEQLARITGARHIKRPAWSEIRIVLSVVNTSMQVLDINGPGYTATGFFQSHLPNVREVVAKNPGLPVTLEIAKDIDPTDPKIAASLAEVRRIAEAAGAKVRIGRTLPATESTPPKAE